MPLDITEYALLARDDNGHVIAAGMEPAIKTQQVAIGATSLASLSFSQATRFLRIHADATCRLEFGGGPTASATSRRMPANGTEFVGVTPGTKVAVITSA